MGLLAVSRRRSALARAAGFLVSAEAVLVCSGAGMSADAGVPVYRGPDGMYDETVDRDGFTAQERASALRFFDDPEGSAVWSAERWKALRAAEPHAGYRILAALGRRLPGGIFVYTSNVDGMGQRAGLRDEDTVERHGSYAWSQCLQRCGTGVFPTTDPDFGRAVCPGCGATSRPNVLMFDDFGFREDRLAAQFDRFAGWLDRAAMRGPSRVVVLEVGAGIGLPTIRNKAVGLSRTENWPLIRVNLHEAQPPENGVVVAGRAAAVLVALGKRIGIAA